ncbi:ranBP-type and C3HC4-type zinc finger-containing protein 1 [Anguilla anguilla]|uniref:ranBP-type and C3HC4-type zinc finger-containing protein 1 n=1 Tax=Anguilla anguilla TaxID=7936 RepID=UPI0015AF98F3|nr:ranBP-type and C3HC4-type zinc finger-containing protein 1 [Anguilla anguilla]
MAAPKGPNVNTLKEAEGLAQVLSEVLSSGDKQEAALLAEKLASLHVPVSVRICPEAYAKDTIQLKVGLEDAQTVNSAPITMSVTPGMTISALKNEVNTRFGFHPRLQTWVIGKRMAQDKDTLCCHGVKQDGDQAFLYIRSAQAAQLTREQHKLDAENLRLEGIIETMDKHLEPRGAGPGRAREPVNPPLTAFPKPKGPPAPPPKPQLGWSCPVCTFVNKPTRPGCEMCGSERPANYQIPDLYQPDEEEVLRIKQEEFALMQYQQALEDQRQKNFQNLLQTDEHSLVPNDTELECPVCFIPILPGEGAILRECLHTFCRDCLKGTITNSMDAEVTCPFGDDTYSCDCKLQDREIRSVLSPEEYQKFLELRLSIAETRSENSFHCKTPNCQGWCIYEDEVNEFVCQLCNKTNCILCKAIHDGMNCKEYQDDLRIRAENDIAAKQTADMLNAMLTSGEAMHCPKCKIIVQKKDGCDWICCVMCKTEMCWVTRQARWGPQGRGDTSGGCRCRVNGPCHPNCQNCH